MAELVRKYQSTQTRMLGERITKSIFSHCYLSEYAAILNWVRQNIRYRRDPSNFEQVKTPASVLSTGVGDCDDMAVLIAALVIEMGGKARFVAGGFRQDRSGRVVLSHVWAEAFDPSSRAWAVLDPVPGRRVNKMLNSLKGEPLRLYL